VIKVIDVNNLIEFSKLYNKLKDDKIKLSIIRNIICKELGLSRTSYYNNLSKCRECGYINDSYQENMNIFLNKVKGKQKIVPDSKSSLILKNWIEDWLKEYEKYIEKLTENKIKHAKNVTFIETIKKIVDQLF